MNNKVDKFLVFISIVSVAVAIIAIISYNVILNEQDETFYECIDLSRNLTEQLYNVSVDNYFLELNSMRIIKMNNLSFEYCNNTGEYFCKNISQKDNKFISVYAQNENQMREYVRIGKVN